MSDNMLKTSNNPKPERGDVSTYVIGFILSLLFTFIPYYLVVNQTISGTQLLLAIVGFAVIQMIIQVTFFLHLGRGPKPNWNLFFFIATIGVVGIVVGGSIMIINNLHYNMSPTNQTKKLVGDEGIYQIGGEVTGACQGQKSNHQVRIKNAQADPLRTVAGKCDTLTFINDDKQAVEISFGTHPAHESYAGEYEVLVRPGRSKSITLSEPGTYNFHDHLKPETTGTFTVTNF